MSFKTEKIVETKKCKQCSASFEITDKDLEFYDKVSPKFNGEKFQIPTPSFCPECRQQRRFSWYNESKIYKSKSDYSKKDIISMFSPDKPYKVYDVEEWMKDNFDPLDFGLDFDFNKTFFEQFKQLFKLVPIANRDVFDMYNSDYVNYAGYLKNCYLIFQSDSSEDCMYGKNYFRSKKSKDCLLLFDSENCFECVDCIKCFDVFYSHNTKNSSRSFFLKNCENCQDCFGCINMVNKKYCFLNKQLTKQEYQKKIKEINFCDQEMILNIKKDIKKVFLGKPNKNMMNVSCENVIGERNFNSKNVIGYDNIEVEDGKYLSGIKGGKILYDVDHYGLNLSKAYEGLILGTNSSSVYFSYSCWENVENILYSYFCILGSKNCFGCVGLKNKQYCIFNKQYTKEEYNILVPKIIEYMKTTGEWGEFFPSNISPFGYNETVAQEYYPLEKQEAISKSFNWSDYEQPLPDVKKIIPSNKLPDNIKDIPDDILNWAIKCEISDKPFRIIEKELEFYRKHNLPIPKRHPDQRHLDRMKLRNPRKLFDRDCDKCSKPMKTTYSPEREEVVYCEECYNREVY